MEVTLNSVTRYDGGYKLVYTSGNVWEKPFVFDAPTGEYPELDEYLNWIVEVHGISALDEMAKTNNIVSKLNIDYFVTKTGKLVVCMLSKESTPDKPIYLMGWSPQERLAQLGEL